MAGQRVAALHFFASFREASAYPGNFEDNPSYVPPYYISLNCVISALISCTTAFFHFAP